MENSSTHTTKFANAQQVLLRISPHQMIEKVKK